jgi:hypothetical protein
MYVLIVVNRFRTIFDSKVKEYQEAQKVKKDKEIEELVERYMHTSIMCIYYVIHVANLSSMLIAPSHTLGNEG